MVVNPPVGIGILTTLGDTIYGAAAGVPTRLPGNITTTKKFLRQTGTGAVSAAPAWDTLVAGDIPDLSGVYQPLDNDLSIIASLTPTTDNFIVSASSAWASRTPAQVRTTLGLVIGTNVQAWDADLDAIAALSPSNDDVIQRKAGAWINRTMAQLKADLALNSVENTALSTWAGSASITTLGTIATGTWDATAIAVAKGGTNITSYAVGDLLYASGATALSKLPGVAVGSVLVSGGVSTAPAYSSTPQLARLGLGQAADGTGLVALTGSGDSFKFNLSDFTSYTQYAFYESGVKVAALSYAGSTSSGFIGGPGALAFGTIASAPVAIFAGTTVGITVKSSGVVQFNQYGAGTATFDASGNITAVSDGDLKEESGAFTYGMDAINAITPILYKWLPESGMETQHVYPGFSAQNVMAAIPEAVGRDPNGRYTLQDRGLIAALVNAAKETDKRLRKLEKK